MALADSNGVIRYQAVVQERTERTPDRCAPRPGDSRIWNTFKTWYPFLVHLVQCILFFVSVEQWINDHNFKTGSPPSLLTPDRYQTQVTGILSLALVIIRPLASSCSALLVRRTIFILLDKTGITLTEMVRLGNSHVPIIPQEGCRVQLL